MKIKKKDLIQKYQSLVLDQDQQEISTVFLGNKSLEEIQCDKIILLMNMLQFFKDEQRKLSP